MVPGLGLDARSWSGVWPHLRGPSTVIALPALGRPVTGVRDLRVEALAEELLGLLPAGPLVLVGHSASCQVVGEAARDGRVAGVVLVGPTTAPDAVSWPAIVARWSRTAVHEHLWEVPLVTPQYRRTGTWDMVRGMDRVRRHRLDAALAAASVPVTVVRGQHDRIADARWARALAARALVSGADGRVTTVPRAGHMVPLTHPRAVAAAVEELRGRLQRAGPVFAGRDSGQGGPGGAHP